MTRLQRSLKSIQTKPKAYRKLMKRKRIYKKVGIGLRKRRAKEARLKFYGVFAISISFFIFIQPSF